MAEKTGTKKVESAKETHESPIADAAHEALEEVKNAEDLSEEDVREKIVEEIEESGVPEEVAEKEEKLDEKESEKAEETVQGESIRKPEEDRRPRRGRDDRGPNLDAWVPKTELGKGVKAGKIKNIDEILNEGKKILEAEIVDSLIDVKSDLIAIGQSKGKFGGGKRRAWRQTQRKTKEGNVPTFSTLAVIGDEKGHVGIGSGRAAETLPAREKAIRRAKINVFRVERACSAFDCLCSEKHTLPFKVEGKAGSVRVELIPAPQGTGLVVGNEMKKVLGLAGVKDVYSRTFGKKRTTFNLIKACIDALKKTEKK